VGSGKIRDSPCQRRRLLRTLDACQCPTDDHLQRNSKTLPREKDVGMSRIPIHSIFFFICLYSYICHAYRVASVFHRDDDDVPWPAQHSAVMQYYCGTMQICHAHVYFIQVSLEPRDSFFRTLYLTPFRPALTYPYQL
jgi:hypothetical protein